EGWHAHRGTLAPGLACGSYIAVTDAWSGPFSRGEFYREQHASVPFAMQVTWQRLSMDEGKSLSFIVRGGFLLLKPGAYGFYPFSESAFRWHDLPGFSTVRESTVRVEQREQEIALWVDGRRVGTIPFAAPRTPGGVGVGLKGERGN